MLVSFLEENFLERLFDFFFHFFSAMKQIKWESDRDKWMKNKNYRNKSNKRKKFDNFNKGNKKRKIK